MWNATMNTTGIAGYFIVYHIMNDKSGNDNNDEMMKIIVCIQLMGF